ncbi:hypothetical protein [Denitromonas iodatirespirans]|uniref:Uncharacterized protein n=1 Tax=Denitromonas iodatirespirans TaxID=2795389 RepID=A0A944H980_DENI1|nr:hypothetical protein [Denitromonas iodatirespirans]MBT0962979.1 hypothetical protein [Denitromonas iodatirespirans]
MTQDRDVEFLAYRVEGKQFARGVVLCLVEAGQSFRMNCVGRESFVVEVSSDGVRFLPIGCELVKSGSAD